MEKKIRREYVSYLINTLDEKMIDKRHLNSLANDDYTVQQFKAELEFYEMLLKIKKSKEVSEQVIYLKNIRFWVKFWSILSLVGIVLYTIDLLVLSK